MRVLVAPDSFGGTLNAAAAGRAIAEGWRRGAPHDEVTVRPLSDGGPGFVDVLAATVRGTLVTVTVGDPLGRPVPATMLLAGTIAYVESAQATGLHLLSADERDPLRTGTSGVGELIIAAVAAGARTVIIGLGGSATNDGGAGMLAALGAVPVDSAGLRLPPGGAALADCGGLSGPVLLPTGVDLIVATDVDNPLTGVHGASAVFGPQKGADRAAVIRLDAALTRWAAVLEEAVPGCPAGLAHQRGGGAAGGLGAALLAVGATRERGMGLVRRLVDLDALLDQADLVVTGEGAFDVQSLRGKVVSGVASAAQDRGLPCLVLAGRVELGRREAAAVGVDGAYSMVDHLGSVDAALSRPADGLSGLAQRVAAMWSR